MKVINIDENSNLRLEADEAKLIQDFLNSFPDSPMKLNENTLIFDNYIVGSVTIDNLLININPRISGLTINHYLEMQLYTEGIIDDKIDSFLSESYDGDIQGKIVDLFLESLENLLEVGLDGDFLTKVERSNNIRGNILVDEITPIDLIFEELPIEFQHFSRDISPNKYLKLALNKVQLLLEDREQQLSYSKVSRSFHNIHAEQADKNTYLLDISSIDYWNNREYKEALNFATKILDDIKLNIEDNQIKNSSYLVNSNTIFEKYIRKILQNNLDDSVTKWNTPKNFGVIEKSTQTILRSYEPDILINYNLERNSAFAVLDVKNKDITHRNNLGNNPDLYQLIFYSSSLKTQYAGLIYPIVTINEKDFGKITLNSFSHSVFYYFTINFKLPIKSRHINFINTLTSLLK